MTTYIRTARERELMRRADMLMMEAAFPTKGWKDIPASPFYLFLMGTHQVLFHHTNERHLTLNGVMHRVWGRIVPYSTLNELFKNAGLTVRPFQLILLYRAVTIVILLRLGASLKEVRGILNLSGQAKIHDILARSEVLLGDVRRLSRGSKDPAALARDLLARFVPGDPNHAAWWLTSNGLLRRGA